MAQTEMQVKGNEQAGAEMEMALKMVGIISGFWVSRVVYIAAKLGLADQLKDGAKTADELAEATATHAPSLYRVMRSLAGAGLLFEDEEKRFSLTPLGATLRSDAPFSLRAFATSELGEVHYPSWGALLHTVRTGERAFDHVFGTDCWDYFSKHPENAQIFNQSMTEVTRVVEPAVARAYDFSGFAKIVDVGGGHGGLLTSILKKSPQSKGVILDSPQVVAGAKARIEAEGLTERCEAVGGNFFESVPEGGDAYIMKHIIHDWDDKEAIAILKNCRRAVKEGGKVILIESVIPKGSEASLAKFADLVMMLIPGGRERTAEEFAALFEAAGFRLERIIPTESPMSVIEAVTA
ncbi:MAG TPA: methyltransferase [Pyrinomonadaceae bacterium]|nr:methyltransferase [Pyrinomonadaceae bacterium]